MRNPNNIKLIKNLSLTLSIEYDSIIHLQITDPNHKRWTVPDYVLNSAYKQKLKSFTPSKSFSNFGINIYDDSFGFELFAPKDKTKIYYTFSNQTFLYSDTLIIFESLLTSGDIFGFGERFHKFKLDDGIYTIWPNDTGGIKKDDGRGGMNLMGHQPIGLHKTKYDDIFLGFVFVNSNNQDVVINTKQDNIVSLQHKTIGGIIDYYIIVDKTPEEVIKKIHYIIGTPMLPPYWAFGWHHSRYGYKDDNQFISNYEGYIDNKIPIDSMWIDIDSLENFIVFTLNKARFNNLPKYINQLHLNNAHFIPIVDLGISCSRENAFINLGKKLNCFIQSNYTKSTLISHVWPGKTIFPDFFNPNTTLLWNYGLSEYEKLVQYDGIWLDMNEPAMIQRDNKCIGEIANTCDPKDNYYYYEYLPYIPGYLPGRHTDIASNSINENAVLYGEDPILMAAYNTKPLISFLNCKVTYRYLYNRGKRPFVLTRSNFIGGGKYAFHWLGDNYANYESLQNSISGIFAFNIFGYPMTGDDICGFFNNTNDDLCARYHNLGAFYPFARNHNFLDAKDQEPWKLGNKTLKAAKKAIKTRYSLLRYIYTEMFMVSLNEKGAFFKPVFFEYPNDPISYDNIDSKIMFGSSFIVFPILTNSTNNINVNFPKDNWNNFPEGDAFINEGNNRFNISISGKFEDLNVFLRGGHIVPYQNTFEKYISNSFYLRGEPTQIIINPNKNNIAKGILIFDNDERDTIIKKKYIRVEMKYSNGELEIELKNYIKDKNYKYKDNCISKIILLRYSQLNEGKKKLKISNAKIVMNSTEESESVLITYDNIKDKAEISLNSIPIEKIIKVSFI